MLEPYEIRQVGIRTKMLTSGAIKAYEYTFHDVKGNKFMLIAEQFEHDLLAIKYYPKAHQESPNRYRLMTNYGQPGRIAGTCVKLIAHLQEKFPLASIGLIGVNSIGERKDNTKRYRFYRRVISIKVSPRLFVHKTYDQNSIYVLVNRRKLEEDPRLVFKLEDVIKPIVEEYFKGEEEKPTLNWRQKRPLP